MAWFAYFFGAGGLLVRWLPDGALGTLLGQFGALLLMVFLLMTSLVAIRRGLREGLDGIGGDLPAMDGIVEIAPEKDTERSRTHPFNRVVRQKNGVFAIFPWGLISCLIKSARHQSHEENHGAPAEL